MQPTRESGEAVSEMDTGFKFGQMVLNMKGFGKIIKPVEMGSLLTQMEIYIKDNGQTIRRMESECTIM